MAAQYGVELRRTLTGFKFIGEQIGLAGDRPGEAQRYIFGFEESYGYLSGAHVPGQGRGERFHADLPDGPLV